MHEGHASSGSKIVQGPSRRLQPDAVLQGRGEGVAAQGIPLLERRWRPDGHPRRTTGRSPSSSRTHGPRTSGSREFTKLRVPKLYNLRADPFERGDESIYYDDWMRRARAFISSGAGASSRSGSELQGIPDPAEARELQPRRGDAEAVGAHTAVGFSRRAAGFARRSAQSSGVRIAPFHAGGSDPERFTSRRRGAT